MFINGSHIFTNVFILPIWEEKIRCTAQRMPLLCWFLFIFPSHFNRYFLAILVFRYNPPQYVKTESGRRDRLAECVDVCPHVHRPFLVKNLRVFKFLSTTVCGKNSSTSYISWDCASQFFQNFAWNFIDVGKFLAAQFRKPSAMKQTIMTPWDGQRNETIVNNYERKMSRPQSFFACSKMVPIVPCVTEEAQRFLATRRKGKTSC